MINFSIEREDKHCDSKCLFLDSRIKKCLLFKKFLQTETFLEEKYIACQDCNTVFRNAYQHQKF